MNFKEKYIMSLIFEELQKIGFCLNSENSVIIHNEFGHYIKIDLLQMIIIVDEYLQNIRNNEHIYDLDLFKITKIILDICEQIDQMVYEVRKNGR